MENSPLMIQTLWDPPLKAFNSMLGSCLQDCSMRTGQAAKKPPTSVTSDLTRLWSFNRQRLIKMSHVDYMPRCHHDGMAILFNPTSNGFPHKSRKTTMSAVFDCVAARHNALLSCDRIADESAL